MSDRDEKVVEAAPPAVTAISLMVSESCNFRCTYCYGGFGKAHGLKMESSTARKAVDWLMQQSKNEKTLRLVFFGGEPLLNFPLIKEISAYTREKSRETGKSVNLEITTNASLIDNEVVDFFLEYDIWPLISFDGPKEIQDLQRPYRNSRGSFDSTAVKIRKLLDRIPGTSCRATWLPGNDPEIVIRGLRECGFARIMLLPATIPSIRDRNGSRLTLVQDYTPLIRQAEKETVRLKKAIRERDAEGVRFIAMASILLTIVRMLLHHHSGEKFCGAGSTLVGVSSTGELYPCHRFFGNHSFRLGNIFNRDFDHWFNPWRNVDDLPACNACEARYTCLGGCYHDNYIGTGDYTIPLPESCRRRKAITALAESVVHDLDEDDKKFLYHENLIQHKQCMLDFG
jgi:uncharacterized protein